MRRTMASSVAVLSLAVMLTGCSAQRDMNSADAAVTHFHAQLNAGNFDQIYADSDNLMKNATSREKFVNLLSAVHRKLGSAKSTDRKGFFINYGNQGETIRLTYSTQYEVDTAGEEFVFHRNGKEMLLAGYHINSDALITQ